MGGLFLISQQSNNTNIYKIKEYISDSVNQLEYIRDINTKLREELKDAKNEIESLQDEIISNLENQIEYLQDEIQELKELNND